jgi:hypothetical protein
MKQSRAVVQTVRLCAETKRDFGHGCIRIEKPVDLLHPIPA